MNRTASLAVLAAVCVFRAEAQVVRPVLSFPREFVSNVAIDDAGTTIYAVTSTNQFGTNPEYRKQIVRWDAASGVGTPITDFEEGVESVSVSGDGSWLAFVSRADPLGTNHDESAELFVMHPDGTGLAQLTSEDLLPLGRRGIRAAVLSGSANRVAFIGRINPLGTNPTYASTLFVVDRDGTNLRQLQIGVTLGQEIAPTGYWPGPGLDISDDGSKIVYLTGSPRSIAGINANGSGNHVFSSTSSPTDVVISGNGAKIVYATGGLENHAIRARSFDGNPFTIVFLGNGESPSITDDATTVYHYRYTSASTGPAGIYRIASTGGAVTPVSLGLQLMRTSGSGNRIAARGAELVAIDNTGPGLQQLTTTTVPGASVDDHAFSTDAAALRFSSSLDPLGQNPTHDYEQFSLALGTGQLTQLTDATLPPIGEPGFSDAGDIYFVAAGNTCATGQLFRRAPDGTLTQVTACPNIEVYPDYPKPRADGQVVSFFGTQASQFEVFAVNADGSGQTQLSPNGSDDFLLQGALTTAGAGSTTWVAYCSNSQIFRVRGDGTGLQQVTTQAAESFTQSISDDGNRLAWSSRGNYVGQNADSSIESFLYEKLTGTTHQLTNNPTDESIGSPPRVTRNGGWVFAGDGRYDANTLALEPATGFPHSASQFVDLQPDATGNRWLIWLYDRLDNHPGASTFFLADMSAPPALAVEKASPTVLSWDPSPTSLRYDVIRGSIANLSIAGSTVSLGPVSCLEDDSPDSHTRGYGDPTDPAPGQAFFFLYRGSVGASAAAGSYGQGTGGKERLAGSGGCNP